MSIENNQLRTIDGLNLIVCDVINVVESIELNGDNGNPNQLIISNGTTVDWGGIDDLMEDLTATSPISFNTGSTYNGLTARTLEIADGAIGNNKLTNSSISGKDLGTNLDNISFTSPLTIDSYNGSTAKTIGIANGEIDNIKLADSTISGVSLGDDLETLTFTGYDTGTYDGSNPLSINLVDTDTTYSAGQNILIDGSNEISTNPTSTHHTALSFKQSGDATSLVGNAIGAKTPLLFFDLDSTSNSFPSATLGATSISLGSTSSNLDMNNGNITRSNLLGGTNLLPSERLAYEGGRWLFNLNAGDWRPNDDSSFYHVAISDATITMGRAKPNTAALELIKIISIPSGWSPTRIYISAITSLGANLSRTLYLYKIRNWGGTGMTYIGSAFTNVETTTPAIGFPAYGAGSSPYSLLIKCMTTTTSDYIGGGYIQLTPPAFF
tara:strand:+ start:9948 stop:11264 length:1317 start_codon:yes stop_codon:yes gene_type:complete